MVCSHSSHYLQTKRKMLDLKYVVEDVGLIIFIFPSWFYRQENQAWGGEESCLPSPSRPGSTKNCFLWLMAKPYN